MAIPSRIGKYEIARLLGHGGMGVVYLGHDPFLDRPVAIKVLREGSTLPDQRARFALELSRAARLQHPNIVSVWDSGLHDGEPFMVMEYIDGQTLAALIETREPLSLGRKLRIVEDVCLGLAHVHMATFVHRDIKPSNIMVDRNGWVKVLDFGIARAPDSDLTRGGAMMGTMSYMAPEQLTGQHVDPRADIFAVGVVLYELLSYQRAFGHGPRDGVLNRVVDEAPVPLMSRCPTLPSELDRVVTKAIQHNPVKRFQDIRVLRAALCAVRERLESEERVSTRPNRDLASITFSGPDLERVSSVSAQEELPAIVTACLTESYRALTTGEFDRAMALCHDALDLQPGNPEAQTLLLQVTNRTDGSRPALRNHAEGLSRRRGWQLVGGFAIVVASVSLSLLRIDSVSRVEWPNPPAVPPAIVAGPPPLPTLPRELPKGPPWAASPLSPPTPVIEPPPVVTTGSGPISATPKTDTPAAAVPTVPAPVTPNPPAPGDTRGVGTADPPAAPPAAPLPTVPVVTSPPGASAQREIRDLLEDKYAAAMTARKVDEVSAIYPGVDQVRLNSQFAGVRSWSVTLKCPRIIVTFSPEAADATCTVTYEATEFTSRPGRQQTSKENAEVHLIRQDDRRWTIDRARFGR